MKAEEEERSKRKALKEDEKKSLAKELLCAKKKERPKRAARRNGHNLQESIDRCNLEREAASDMMEAATPSTGQIEESGRVKG